MGDGCALTCQPLKPFAFVNHVGQGVQKTTGTAVPEGLLFLALKILGDILLPCQLLSLFAVLPVDKQWSLLPPPHFSTPRSGSVACLTELDSPQVRTAVVIKTYTAIIRNYSNLSAEEQEREMVAVRAFARALFANIRGPDSNKSVCSRDSRHTRVLACGTLSCQSSLTLTLTTLPRHACM
jgi:hypothetical protein